MIEIGDSLFMKPQPSFSPPMVEPSEPSHDPLDDLPVRVIRPRSGWIRVDWKELFAYRELLWYLVMRDISVRYKQSVLGSAWAVIQPVTMMVIFTVVFGRIAKVPHDDLPYLEGETIAAHLDRIAKVPHDELPYPVFVFAGLIPWTMFSQGFTKAATSLVQEVHLMSKVYFPRIFLPTAGIAVFLVDLVISVGIYALVLLYYGVMPSWTVIFVPLLVVLTFIATMSFGLMFGSLMVFYRDVRFFVPFLSQILLFLTPVVYPVSLIRNPAYRWIMSVNPLFGIVAAFRSAILGVGWDFPCLAISTATALVSCMFAVFYFRRMEHFYVDFV